MIKLGEGAHRRSSRNIAQAKKEPHQCEQKLKYAICVMIYLCLKYCLAAFIH